MTTFKEKEKKDGLWGLFRREPVVGVGVVYSIKNR